MKLKIIESPPDHRDLAEKLDRSGDYAWNEDAKLFECRDTGITMTYAEAQKLAHSGAAPYKSTAATPEAKMLQAAARARGMKALTGSSKQKKWAEEIREKVTSVTSDPYLLKTFGSELRAKFWIENRDISAMEIARKLADSETWARTFIETNLSRQHGFHFWVVEASDPAGRYSFDIYSATIGVRRARQSG